MRVELRGSILHGVFNQVFCSPQFSHQQARGAKVKMVYQDNWQSRHFVESYNFPPFNVSKWVSVSSVSGMNMLIKSIFGCMLCTIGRVGKGLHGTSV